MLSYDNRVGRVLLKLAIGHATYELSEGYCTLKWSGTPLYIKYIIKSTICEAEWNDLEYPEPMNDKMLPEMGSRVFRNFCVLQMPLVSFETKEQLNLNLTMMDWTDIQDGAYRYLAYFEDDKLVVKMIIMNYLYGEVVFKEYSTQNDEIV